jgi:hypothetical protein
VSALKSFQFQHLAKPYGGGAAHFHHDGFVPHGAWLICHVCHFGIFALFWIAIEQTESFIYDVKLMRTCVLSLLHPLLFIDLVGSVVKLSINVK